MVIFQLAILVLRSVISIIYHLSVFTILSPYPHPTSPSSNAKGGGGGGGIGGKGGRAFRRFLEVRLKKNPLHGKGVLEDYVSISNTKEKKQQIIDR